jgi:hypothetical protein
MNDFEKGLIFEFLSDRWALFVSFCRERDLSEDDADEIMKKLEEEAK